MSDSRVPHLVTEVPGPRAQALVARSDRAVSPSLPRAYPLAVKQARRADAGGNTQIWGLLGVQKEVAFAAERVIVVVEEIVDEDTIRSDPNRTAIPGLLVDAVVHEPYGAHPSYAQGYYDRDNQFYLAWDRISRDEAATRAWLDEWVYGVADRASYLAKLEAQEPGFRQRLAPGEALSQAVNYGVYR